MSLSTSPSARVDFRTTPEMKNLIERAAIISGMTVSEFIKSVIFAKSQEIISQHETRILSDKDRDIFLALLDNPGEPNEALCGAIENFKKSVEDGSLII